MLFSSITFLFAFLALVLVLYFIVPRKMKNFVLLIFSLVFYAWGEAVYILLMLASITVAYVTGIFADKTRKEKEPRQVDWVNLKEQNNMIPINKRNIGISIFLSIVTFGVYLIYWKYLLVKNIRALKEDDSSCTGEMLCLILVPFYPLYWWLTRGKYVNDKFASNGYSATSNEIVYLILSLFGLEIISIAIMQNDFNSLPSKINEIVAKPNQQRSKATSSKIPFISVLFAVIWSIGLLLFFKYTDFFITNANSFFGLKIKLLGLALPIGISFYSFQALSYVIDVYRGEVKAQKNFITLATYISLFPQLIAGPIVRYQTIEKQLISRKETADKFAQGIKRFAVGLGKKVILANNIGFLFTEISGTTQSELSITASWIGIIAYTFQIYFDFSGYSDMAIGLGKMFGFDFLENFNYPYISKSITDFWRRWHISLSSWFRDYVYIPLGGNRKGLARQCLNIMIVWFLTGFWHGANWNFMIWGVYFGILLLIEKIFIGKVLNKIPSVFQHIYALIFIVIGWGIFAFEDTSLLINNFKNMFHINKLPLINDKTVFWLTQYAVTFVILIIASTPLFKKLGEKLSAKIPAVYGCVIQPIVTAGLLVVSTAYLASNSFNPFLYFRF